MADYTGLDFLQIDSLDYLTYLTWRRDAFIYRWMQTDKGRDYLDNAWRLEQTKPDRGALRKQLRKEDTDG